MFAAVAPLPLGAATAGAGPAALPSSSTGAELATAAAAAAAAAAATAAAAAEAAKVKAEAKAKAKAKAKVAKPLSPETVQAVAQKWCGAIMLAVAAGRAQKNDLMKNSFGSDLVTKLEELCTESMAFHARVQGMLTDGNMDVEMYRDLMQKGDESKGKLVKTSSIAAALLKATNPSAKAKAKGKAKAKASP